MPRPARIVSVACALLTLTVCLAADWPQWRGPRRDGSASAIPKPKAWPDKLSRLWSVQVGEGHASPLVVGDRVFVHARQSDQEVAQALSLRDGKTVWRQAWPVAYEPHRAAAGHGRGPKSTPVAEGGTLYTFGISGVVSALDAQSGTLRWRKDFASQHKTTSPLFGTSMSPLVDKGLLVAHVGGHHDGSLTAWDAATGETRWSLKGDGPGYASPIIAEMAGKRQIITQTDQRIVGVAAGDGALLWSLPFTTAYDQNIVTPIVFEKTLIISGYEKGVRAYAIEAKEGSLVPREVWSRQEVSLYMSSPVIVSGRLFGFSHLQKGQFVCLDARTGSPIWMSEGREGENAALVASADLVLALTDGAELLVLPVAGDRFQPLARYRVAESPTWTHPVLTHRGLLVKDKTSLSLWSWPS